MDKEKILDAVKKAVNALEDKLALDIVVLKISELTPIADYFIIAGANNPNQLKAMADSVEEAMAKNGIGKIGTEGAGNKNWVLLDFNSIVVHLFDKESRDFYNLERIWADAERVEF